MWILSSEQSLWSEIWEYLLYRYFNPPLPYFDNLSNRMESWSVILVIGAVFLGIMVAGIAFVLFQRMLGSLPRSLVELGAVSPETAIVPREKGLRLPRLLTFSLRRPTSALRRYVRYVGQSDPTYEEQLALEKSKSKARVPTVDFSVVPIYLVAERKDECLRRFSKKGNDGKSIAILVSVFTVLFFVVCRFLPEILSVVDGMMGL